MLTGKELPDVSKGLSKSAELLKRKQQAVSAGISTLMPFFIKEAKGSVVEDVDGNLYLDFYSGIGVVNAGHRPDIVEKDVKDQLDRYIHTCFMITPYEPYVDLAEKLAEITPIKGEAKVAFFNSGAEAVENAIKIARTYTNREGVISFSNAFHGRTLLTMTMTSKVKPYKYGFGPFAPEIYKLSSAYCYRCPFGLKYPTCNMYCLDEIEKAFISEIDASRIAAMIIEPVQGEGGFVVQPKEFLQGLQNICKKHGIVFIVDEIQTGFARTGTMFSSEQYGIEPDLITLAKSIASGMPISAVVGKKAIMDSVEPGGIGGTYGGNPLACVSGLSTIEYMEKNDFVNRSNIIGKYILDKLKTFQTKYENIGDVRGLGAMVAVEIVQDRATKEPDKEKTAKVIKECVNEGLLVIGAGVFGNVIRFLPPLSTTDEQLRRSMEIFENALNKVF